MKRLLTYSILGAAALIAGLLLATTILQTQATATNNQLALIGADHLYQVEISGQYKPFGQPGHFKLLADTTPNPIMAGHVALSNINCASDGTSPFVLLLANAQVGAGNTAPNTQIVPLNSANMIHDVSAPGFFCTYHVDIHSPGVNATGGVFPITDLAIVNTNNGATVAPHKTASATIHVQDCLSGFPDTVSIAPCGFVRIIDETAT
ncbi:MAG TPA: hypothetical protein VD736_08480 [Nitrososphaera sp.]|nr:hypothetical protein [Nitrososphaera sp.]